VKTVRALKKRYVDRHLAVGRRRQLKKKTLGEGRSWKKFAVAHRGMTRHAGVAQCKGRGHKGPMVEERRRKNQTRDNVARGTSKGRMFG
jgi:hypothetical protein